MNKFLEQQIHNLTVLGYFTSLLESESLKDRKHFLINQKKDRKHLSFKCKNCFNLVINAKIETITYKIKRKLSSKKIKRKLMIRLNTNYIKMINILHE